MRTGMKPVVKNLAVTEAWDGVSVQEAVRLAFPEIGPRQAFKMCRMGEILLDGAKCAPLTMLTAGNFIAVTLYRQAEPEEIPVTTVDTWVKTPFGPLMVIREDANLLVVMKSAGTASHPALRHFGDTLVERVAAYLGPNLPEGFKPALANRLDIETSGIVLIGKDHKSRASLGHDLQKRRIGKRYLALVAGVPPKEGEITLPLDKKPDSRDLATYPEGHPRLSGRLQEAHTRYRVVASSVNPISASLVEVELLTGRTHQIRRHFAMIGHPVALDKKHGDRDFNSDILDALSLDRMFLHAHFVNLPHPKSRKELALHSPLGEDLALCLAELGLSGPEGLAEKAAGPAA